MLAVYIATDGNTMPSRGFEDGSQLQGLSHMRTHNKHTSSRRQLKVFLVHRRSRQTNALLQSILTETLRHPVV